MNGRKLLVTNYNNAIVSLLTDKDGKTVQINAETEEKHSIVGNIYAANVRDVTADLGGAFIEYESGRMGFLRIKNSSRPVFINTSRNKGPVRQGDIVLVQAAADAVKMKDPLFSDKISIAARYAVLVYPGCGIKFSSRIRSEEFRNEASAFLSDFEGREYGFIIRTSSERADLNLVRSDMIRLSDTMNDIIGRSGELTRGLLYEKEPMYISDLSDCFGDYDEVVTDYAECFRKIRAFLEANYPEDAGRLRAFGITSSMSVVYGIEKRMREALDKKVYLKSGGFLVIEPTEALVVIDVNSGSALRPDFLKINTEAAREIARQIRLRNLSGIIIVDFISMNDKEKDRILINEIKDHLADDPAKPVVCDMTKLGLLEITRKKTRRPLYEITDIC